MPLFYLKYNNLHISERLSTNPFGGKSFVHISFSDKKLLKAVDNNIVKHIMRCFINILLSKYYNKEYGNIYIYIGSVK